MIVKIIKFMIQWTDILRIVLPNVWMWLDTCAEFHIHYCNVAHWPVDVLCCMIFSCQMNNDIIWWDIICMTRVNLINNMMTCILCTVFHFKLPHGPMIHTVNYGYVHPWNWREYHVHLWYTCSIFTLWYI